MLIEALRIELSAILSEEEANNWEAVEVLSERTYVRLTTEDDTSQDYLDEDVIGYLAGFTRRRSDQGFADHQHRWLAGYLRSAP